MERMIKEFPAWLDPNMKVIKAMVDMDRTDAVCRHEDGRLLVLEVSRPPGPAHRVGRLGGPKQVSATVLWFENNVRINGDKNAIRRRLCRV